MGRYVLDFAEIDATQVALVGGKGANLGELSRIDGIRVPAGFCVTTDAFVRVMAEAPSVDDQLDRLSRLAPDDGDAIRTLSAEIRRTIEATAIPDDLAAEITRSLAELGGQAAYAVRSSATAEDSPTTSFAGQQDTYLNLVGPAAILQHVSRCWASLFTERAVTYRLRNGVDHGRVRMAVVVQQMVFAQAAGILFTADPVTGNRKVASVEASFGLGEALVSGLVNADRYTVRDGEIVTKTVGTKQLAIVASPTGGTREQAIEPERRVEPALTDAPGRSTRGAGPADRGAFRPSPGHRVVPGRRWIPDRPEPPDHDAVPHPGGRRSREPRLRLRRARADDDRRHEAPGAFVLPHDDPGAHGRSRRAAVRRRHLATRVGSDPRRTPRGDRHRGPADAGRPRDRPRTRRLHPTPGGRGLGRPPQAMPVRRFRARPASPQPSRSRPIRPSSST